MASKRLPFWSFPVTTIEVPRLRDDFGGRVTAPGDAGYEQARTLFYGGFEQRPAASIRPPHAPEGARGVGLARDSGTQLAGRSGGHSTARDSHPDGGVVD